MSESELRFSARESHKYLNLRYFYDCVGSEARQQPTHPFGAYGDAPFRRRSVVAPQMKENRATSPLAAARKIVVEDKRQIVETVVAPQFFVAGGEGEAHQAIVIGISGRIAPAIAVANRFQGNERPRSGVRADPEKPADDGMTPLRRSAVAFPLGPCDAATANHAGNDEIASPNAPSDDDLFMGRRTRERGDNQFSDEACFPG